MLRCPSPLVLIGLLASLVTAASPAGVREVSLDEVRRALPRQAPAHPRLILTPAALTGIRAKVAQDPAWHAYAQAIQDKADAILPEKPVTRIKTGRRLLGVSRRCLDRVLALSMAYQLSAKRSYLQRAEQEMLAAAAFSDWNPSHFLDVAEMTAALAFGYDWLYEGLSPEARASIRRAILDKGIAPAFKVTHWVRGHNNWNQVCNGGITLGALAVMEDAPDLALKLIHRAVNGVQVAMAVYEPDGAYPEGPGYWVYGTSYNCVLLSALQSVLGTDFGLSDLPGFSRGGDYYLHVTGPRGYYFNYPDSGSRGGFVPAVFWFAQRYGRPDLAWTQHRLWREAVARKRGRDLVGSRLAPLTLLWATDEVVTPRRLAWMGRGPNAVALFRTAWDRTDATFLGIKGGSPSVNHGHMDVGSFVLDLAGKRWAADLGPESYNKIESRGMNLWGHNQDAQRWTIYRYNNLSHNTLVVNGQPQRVDGYAPITHFAENTPFPHVVIDLSEVYAGQLAAAQRGAALLPDGRVLLQDELIAPARRTTVRWAMVTPAEVTPGDRGRARLTQGDQMLSLRLLGDAEADWTTFSTAPKADYDAPNPGTRQAGFTLTLKPGQHLRYAVVLGTPQVAGAPVELRPLADWSAPLKTQR